MTDKIFMNFITAVLILAGVVYVLRKLNKKLENRKSKDGENPELERAEVSLKLQTEDDDIDGKLVTIARYASLIDADLAKMRLKSEGIKCVLADEHMVQMNWLYSNAVGGVKLQVQEEDVDDARKALNSKSEDAEYKEKVLGRGRRCPNCKSTEVYLNIFNRKFAFLSWIILGIPLPFLNRKWFCKTCGKEWRK